jgi:high-affinity nickel permease
MLALLSRTFDEQSAALRRSIIGLYTLLIIGNIAVWGCTILAFRQQLLLLGTALLAYGFGDDLGALNDNLNGLGFIVIGIFVVTRAASVVFYRYAGFDANEMKAAEG